MNGREVALLIRLGISAAAALMASFQSFAMLLGVDAEAGTLEAGRGLPDAVSRPPASVPFYPLFAARSLSSSTRLRCTPQR